MNGSSVLAEVAGGATLVSLTSGGFDCCIKDLFRCRTVPQMPLTDPALLVLDLKR